MKIMSSAHQPGEESSCGENIGEKHHKISVKAESNRPAKYPKTHALA
jgi:hypothetical protein